MFKKYSLTGLAAILLAFTASSQVTFGPMLGGGANIITVNVDPEPEGFEAENTSGFGFFLGGFAELELSEGLYVRPELHYALRGSSDTETETTTTTILGQTVETTTENDITARDSFLEIPVLIGYEFSEGFSVQAGPAIGLLLGSSASGEVTTTTDGESTTVEIDSDSTEGRNGFEFGLALGLNYRLESGLGFGVRYTRALTDIAEDNEFLGTTINQNYNLIRLNLSYTLGL